MARPPKNQPVDLSHPASLTVGLIDRLVCPEGKDQAFLRDALVPGLRVRVSAQGAKTFVFERKIGQRTVRRTLGDVRVHHERFEAWILDQGGVHFSPLAKRPSPIDSQKS